MTARLLAVIGTDTGVGKTVVGAGLIHGLLQAGRSVAAFKPVETGLTADRRPGHLTGDPADPPDWLLLSRVSGQPAQTCLGESFPLPAAPLAAARDSNLIVNFPALDRRLDLLINAYDFVVLEGAGGLCVPYTETLLWADIVQRWAADCLVVGRLGLGTLNHTLLTVNELRRRRVSVLGVILNTLAPPGPEAEQTPGLIQELGQVDVLDVVPQGVVEPRLLSARLSACGLLDRLTSRYRTG
ncbi:MAG: dethiobiotin synthase [bacterium]